MVELTWRKSLVEGFSGLGMGFLVGFVLGLAITNVVAAFITSLGALLGAYLGLSNKDDVTESTARSLRIGVFGIACSVGLVSGITLRAHDALSVPPKVRAAAWVAAGATATQAVQYVALEKLGVIPGNAVLTDKASPSGNITGLMSKASNDECAQLAQRRFDSLSNRIAAMENAGGRWASMATSTSTLSESQRAPILQASYQLACGE